MALFVVLQRLSRVHQTMSDLKAKQEGDQTSVLLNQNIQSMQDRLDKTTTAINDRLDRAAQVIGGVQKDLGTMTEIGRNLKDFQDLLRSPKLRGNLGESILSDTLGNFFSRDHYTLQYKFRNGQTVDAIIQTTSGIIPIDSKFPLENFRLYAAAEGDAARETTRRAFLRDVKKHIDDISRKYILTDEGTLNFAVMYVPAESIYTEMSADEEIMSWAHSHKVQPVSPNIFLNFLQTIMMGLEKQKLNEEAQKIWELVKALQADSGKLGEAVSLLDRHLTNAKNAMDGVNKQYLMLDSKVDQVKLLK